MSGAPFTTNGANRMGKVMGYGAGRPTTMNPGTMIGGPSPSTIAGLHGGYEGIRSTSVAWQSRGGQAIPPSSMAGSFNPMGFSKTKTAIPLESPNTEQGSNESIRYPRSCLPHYDKQHQESFMVPGARELAFLWHHEASSNTRGGIIPSIAKLKTELKKYANTERLVSSIASSVSSNPMMRNQQTYSLLSAAEWNYMKVRDADEEMQRAMSLRDPAVRADAVKTLKASNKLLRTPRTVYDEEISFDGTVFEHGTETSHYQNIKAAIGKSGKQVNVTMIQNGQIDAIDYCDDAGVIEGSGVHMVLRRFKYEAGVEYQFIFATENHKLQTTGAAYRIKPMHDLYVVQIAFVCHPTDNQCDLDEMEWAKNLTYDDEIVFDGCTQLLGTVYFANKAGASGRSNYRPPHTPETVEPVRDMIKVGFNKRPINIRLHVNPL